MACLIRLSQTIGCLKTWDNKNFFIFTSSTQSQNYIEHLAPGSDLDRFGSNWHELEQFYSAANKGNPIKNELRIVAAEQAFKDNLNCLVWNLNTGFEYLGIFTTVRDAKEYMKEPVA